MNMYKDLKEDAHQCYLYLQELSSDNNDRIYFNKIHKIAYSYLQLNNILNDDESKIYYQEILSNIICMLYSYKTLSEKIINMLNRNTIDNILRICRLKYKFTDEFRKKYIEDKFKMIKQHNSYNSITAYSKKLDYLLNEYKIACGYVHSTQLDYLSLCSNLKEYSLGCIDFDKINKFYKNVLFILLVIYESDLKKKNYETVCKVRTYLDKNDLIEYVNYFYCANFKK